MYLRFLNVFLFGISSGIPFLLILSTLIVWLTESGLNKLQISLFSYTTISYSFKFFLSIFIEKIKIPFLYKNLGHRKSWLLFSQFMLFLGLIGIGMTNPMLNYKFTAFFSFLVGFFSAIQDILIEAYRIEIFKNNNIGYGVSISILGYRIGMLISSAGTIFFVILFNSWSLAYFLMAFFLIICILNTIFSFEPVNNFSYLPINGNFFYILKFSILEFSKNYNLLIILIFIIFFRSIDVMINIMLIPFLIEIGFNRIDIAYTCKSYGILAMIIGVILGGFLVSKNRIWSLLLICSFLQIFSCVLFIFQAFLKKNIFFLFVTIGFENFISGISQVVFITYLSFLCKFGYTAIHYSFFSSISSFSRINFSLFSGIIAENLIWEHYFFVISFFGFPSIFLLIKYFKFFIIK